MKYLTEDPGMRDADSGDEAGLSVQQLEQELAKAQRELVELTPGYAALQKTEIQLRIAELLVDLNRREEAFDTAREAFDGFIAAKQWEGAVQACNIMFLADQSQSLAALGQGVWLAVTFPIDPELSVAMLQHIIDETPADSDGAAVAAALFLPVVSRISARSGISMSRLLMPMGFCAILGGTVTMVGSSPLILLNDLILTSNKALPAEQQMDT